MATTKKEKIDVGAAAEVLQGNRIGIVLTGRVRNGKVELDQATLDRIGKKFARANKAFVAVNAPFDPNPVNA